MIFDIAPAELLVLGAVALVVIPPKDLPKAMRVAGQWMGRARGMARTFRSGFDDMIRESEFQEMEKKWRAENERIMRDFPPTDDQKALMAPVVQEGSTPGTESDEVTPVMVQQPAIADEPAPPPPPAKPRRTTAAKSQPRGTAAKSKPSTGSTRVAKPRATKAKS